MHDGGEGTRRWRDAGSPIVPSLVAGEVTTPILHVSQLAAALGLQAPTAQDATRAAWETLPVLRSWLDHLRGLDGRLLTEPTASRGRNLGNLTVNVFHPFELLPEAWETLDFPWEPERDDERGALLETPADVTRYAERILAGWTGFVLQHADELGSRDPVVASPRGQTGFAALLASQLEHALFHHEQLLGFLREQGLLNR